MKKYIENTGMRLLAALLCTIATLGLIVVGGLVIAMYQYGTTEDLYKYVQQRIASNYSAYIYEELIEQGKDETELIRFLEGTNMSVAVVYDEASQGEEKLLFEYINGQLDPEKNINPIKGQDYFLEEIYKGSVYTYNIDSIWKAMQSHLYYDPDSQMIPTKVTEFVYDLNTGIFYYNTVKGLYEVTYLYVCQDGISMDYRLVTRNGVRGYYNDYYGVALEKDSYKEWDWVEIDNWELQITDSNEQIVLMDDSEYIEEHLCNDSYYTSGNTLFYADASQIDKYNIYIQLPVTESSGLTNGIILNNEDMFWQWREIFNQLNDFMGKATKIIFGFLFLLVVGLVLLGFSAVSDAERLGFFHKIPVFSYSLLLVLIEVVGAALAVEMAFAIYHDYYNFPMDLSLTLLAVFAGAVLFVGFLYLANIIARLKCKVIWRYSEFYYILKPIRKLQTLAKDRIPFFWKMVLTAGGIIGIDGLLGLIMYETSNSAGGFVVYLGISRIILLALVIAVILQMKILQEAGKTIAEGNGVGDLDTTQLKGVFKDHGENLNSISESIDLAVEKQMKNERFKTELITNVSHDIKTPLTSIINYVDLLKKEEITDATICEYVDVLDRQSSRLKKLIEDLMEASKASTGNLSVQWEKIDLTMLLSQVEGEFEDKLKGKQLELITKRPESPVMVSVDGRHMWRILDNLMTNICKYSQENTRVYVSLQEEASQVILSFKNISQAALNIPSDELTERFVRGDSSRNTEGSGLGLSIAQSLTELMHGNMKIDIDGDLFKVTLVFPYKM